MADALINVVSVTGQNLTTLYNVDADSVTTAAGTALRERSRLGGGLGTELSDVKAAALGTFGAALGGLVVRPYMPSDGTNTMPVGDALARALFARLSDGVTSVGVDAGTGGLKTFVVGGAGGGTASTFGAGFPAAGTAVGFTDGANMGPGRIVAIPNPAYTNTGQVQVAVSGMNAALTSPGSPYYGMNVFAIRNGSIAPGDGQTQSLITDSAGNLKINIAAGGAAGGTSSTIGAAVPSLATAAGFTDGSTLQFGRVTTAALGSLGGVIMGLVVRPYVATDGTNTTPVGDALARAVFTRIGDGTTGVGVDAGTSALKVTQTTAEQVIGYDDNATAITAGSNRPVQVGFRATTSINARTLLADGNASFILGTLDGRVVTVPVHPGDRLGTTPVTMTVTGNNTLIAAQAAGVKIALAGIAISNTSAVNTEVSIKDGTTEIGRFPAPATSGMAPVEFPVPLVGTAATVMNVAILANASSVTVTPFAYKTQL